MSKLNADWEKVVDRRAEKFREECYKAFYNFYGSTSANRAADDLAAAYAIIVKGREVEKVEKLIFTKEFFNIKEGQ